MWWKALDMIELATIVSSIGTLALAITSIYQIRRSERDSFYPILSVDDAKFETNDQVLLSLRNYGTGPGLHVKMEFSIDGRKLHTNSSVNGHPLSVFHVGTNETKEVLVEGVAAGSKNVRVKLRYECIRGRKFHNGVPLDEFLVQRGRPRDISRKVAQSRR